MLSLKDVKTRKDFAVFLGIELKFLTYILYHIKVENLYTTFEIPKKNGGTRIIDAPDETLKKIQKRLMSKLYNYQNKIKKDENIKINISHGFEKGKSIITNARIHRNKRFVLNIDLKDFFASFHFGRVIGFFEKNINFRIPKDIAIIIAQLCCYKGSLPQGAPTSPIISNMICNIFDMRVLKLAKKYKLDYTRYADDLTFSTNNKDFLNMYNEFLLCISKEVEKAGFCINQKKTRLFYKDSRQEVTGLVVNKKISINHNYCKYTRAMANSLYKNRSFNIDGEDATMNQLEGRFAFINQIDWYNNIININDNKHNKGKKNNDKKLNCREKEYQKFIFYKYFFANQKPLIITEGKTDILYLKSAIKSLYTDFPDLIKKNNNDKFEFKISFLRRTKRLEYFLNFVKDGADSIQNIYRFFVGREVVNYSEYFKKITKDIAANPVILIFDNEIPNNKKPVRKFINFTNKKEFENMLDKELYANIVDNLFIITNQLVRDKKECEIEDLFDDKILNHKIDGKVFCRDLAIFDKQKHYSKEIFSKYISKNYKDIDFINFKPMLKNIVKIITNYKR
ncbi:retron Ec67 family RNA-directed DNA polymerase/endonuclease [uncultured Campylobacter sp.]|uniref:retron Ec67 family RNA-directed DNA polymerase/endonuclease n=1 Tax=uncultured Campylobacter sp. TaxID=218934 RepID=UPI0026249DF5|nr:retron Ec67 family RNA-directed DNA polymerase/endonuclease [uncultured Campylobacter sp.]